jgi:hypothetical protein
MALGGQSQTWFFSSVFAAGRSMLNRDWRSHLKKRAISVTLSKNILALFSGGKSILPQYGLSGKGPEQRGEYPYP